MADWTKTAFGQIIVSVLGLIVLWMVVMAAFHTSEITAHAVAPIEEFGKQMGGMWKYAPIVPGGGSVASVQKGMQTVGTSIESNMRDKSQEQANSFARRLGVLNKTTEELNKTINNLKSHTNE